MGFLDLLLSIVNTFCGASSSSDEKPTGGQRPPRPQQPQSLPLDAWPSLPSQAQHPTGRQDHEAHHDTGRPTFEAPVQPPDQQQPQHDRTRYQDQNQANQHNEHYMSLRAKANQEGDEMAKCFQQSHEAQAA
ncbi:hypothetical protein M405DRAFT_936997 [Rhizopogon salebrosus TDB-379]|nr:hypothetical protein M405DRAFT_936997 [Rhizopogon salebrosus TDB-379]